jgi:protein-disulfide isomerase
MAIRSGFVSAGCDDDQTGGPGGAGEPLVICNECRQPVAEQYRGGQAKGVESTPRMTDVCARW